MSTLPQRTISVLAMILGTTCLVSLSRGEEPRNRTLQLDRRQDTWVEVLPPSPGTPEGELHDVRQLLDQRHYRKADKQAKRFMKDHGEAHPLYPAAMIARAEALIGRRQFYNAHKILLEFLNRFSGLELTAEALRLEFVIADTYLSGTRRRWAGLRILSGVDTANSILDDIATNYPEDRLAPLAIKTKADYLFRKGDYLLAEIEYERLQREYPNSRYNQLALRRSAESALSSFAGIEYDEAALIEAGERYREYRLEYPKQAEVEGVGLILEGVRERRAAKALNTGRYYERTKHLESARFYYRTVIEQWPDTAAAAQAIERLALLEPLVGSAPPATAPATTPPEEDQG